MKNRLPFHHSSTRPGTLVAHLLFEAERLIARASSLHRNEQLFLLFYQELFNAALASLLRRWVTDSPPIP
ncbi:MAG: hypothetical protein MKZ70_11360 [Opitutales bacterium]|nr:hypothetical protein [Opitutales bacterium]